MRFKHYRSRSEAELEITSFLNLMIILVPVLLVMMVFSRITVVDLRLPNLADTVQPTPDLVKQLEVVLYPDSIGVNYPAGIEVKRIANQEGDYDFALLSLTLQEVKRQLREQDVDKRDLVILSRPDTTYQTLVSTMDTVRSYKAVVVTDVVDAELFPEIALGDAPIDPVRR